MIHYSKFITLFREGFMVGPNMKKLELKEINYMRQLAGMQKIKIKKRECLSCGKMFKSYDVGHRICDKCRPTWQAIANH